MNKNIRILSILILILTSLFTHAQVQIGLDIDGEANYDKSGWSVSMSDKETIAIGAIENDGNGSKAGHVRIYKWNGTSWLQKGTDIDGEAGNDNSGVSVTMPDSNLLAIGAHRNDGTAFNAGHVRIYRWNGVAWAQKGTDIDGEGNSDESGKSISMPDTNTVAIGAAKNDGNGTDAGHVRIFRWNGSSWVQKGTDLDGIATDYNFGRAVSMPDSNTVAVSSKGDLFEKGEVYIYDWNGTSWIQRGSTIVGEATFDLSGHSLSMPSANCISIGATQNAGNGNQSGHVRIYEWNGANWSQKGADIDGEANDNLSGASVSMPDSNTVAIGANWNTDNGIYSGHVRVYRWNGSSWLQDGNDIDGEASNDQSGYSVDMPDAGTLAVGAFFNGGNGPGSGHTRVFGLCTSTTTDIINTCGSITWIDGKTYTTDNNTAKDTLTNAGGCDSIITLNLTILSSATITEAVDVCSGNDHTYADGTSSTNITVNESHVSTLVGQANNGCDSVVTENITVLSIPTNTEAVDVCSGNDHTYADGTSSTNITVNESHVSTLVGQANNGCDSVITENITVLSIPTNTEAVDVCSGNDHTYADGTSSTNITVNESHVSTLVGQANNGCDSVVTENITVLLVPITNQAIENCDSLDVNGVMYYSTQMIRDTLIGQANSMCDSIVVTDLTIYTTSVVNRTQIECDSSVVNNTMYFASQMVYDTLIGKNCDSIVITDLTIHTTAVINRTQSDCDSSLVNNTMYFSSQMIYDTLPGAHCDSIVITDLTINNAVYSSEIKTSCGAITINGILYNSSQLIIDVFPSLASNGCDSTHTTDLTVSTFALANITINECNSATVFGITYSADTVVSDTIINGSVNNCDTITVATITIKHPPILNQNLEACLEATINGNVYFTSQIVTDIITGGGVNGCDSIVITDLTINEGFAFTVDTTIAQGSSINVGTSTYNSDGTYIDSLVTSQNCDSVITTNLTVIISDIKGALNRTNIYPNPVNNQIFIDAATANLKSIQLLDVHGKVFLTKDNLNTPTLKLDVENLNDGVYFMRMEYIDGLQEIVHIVKMK